MAEKHIRFILDILHRLNDASEPEFIRWRVALALFYEGDLPRSDYPEAMQKLADFLNCGQTLPRSPAPPLLDWEQDAPLIAADINKAAGCEVRALPYLHWWTFMAWFNSIGDGQLATLQAAPRPKIAAVGTGLLPQKQSHG